MIDPIVKELTVPVGVAHAFRVFTENFGDWWPVASHSLSATDAKLPRRVILNPGVGAAITEELHDGRVADWGKITEWVPGSKLAFTWHLRRPETEQTNVYVEFSPVGDATLIRLVHQGWESMGNDGVAAREQYYFGWDIVVACFRKAADV